MSGGHWRFGEMWRRTRTARRAGGSVISSRLKQRATPEDSPLIHTVVLQARTSLAGYTEHMHTCESVQAGDAGVIHRITHGPMIIHT